LFFTPGRQTASAKTSLIAFRRPLAADSFDVWGIRPSAFLGGLRVHRFLHRAAAIVAAVFKMFVKLRHQSNPRIFSPLFEIARVLVRFDHVAGFIVNANHSIA
jgi:hypothetical protein